MDIRMPGVDGLEATRRIVADPRLAGVQVVILTTFDLDEYVFEALRAGASGFLVKDTEPAELIHGGPGGGRAATRCSRRRVTRRLIAEFAGRVKRRPPAAGSTRSPTASGRSWRWSRPGCPTTRSPPGCAQPGHGQDPRQPDHDQARRARPRAARGPRLRGRPGQPGWLT